MKNTLSVLVLVLSLMGYARGQVAYIPEGTTLATAPVTLTYSANPGGNRPFLQVAYPDKFSMFEWVMPVCAGDYSWCLRNDDNQDVAVMSLVFGEKKKTLTVKVKYLDLFYKQPDREKLKKHIELLKGNFVRAK